MRETEERIEESHMLIFTPRECGPIKRQLRLTVLRVESDVSSRLPPHYYSVHLTENIR